MISIVTPTIRKEGLDLVQRSISNQSHRDFEWLIGSPFDPGIPEAKWVEDDFEGGYWSLNRIYNRLFREAGGDIIVTWQDWIWTPPDGLSKFDSNVRRTNAVVSGVGDQYETVGQFGKPQIKIWSDPRKTLEYGSFYEVNPNDAEWNWCAFPREAIFDIGGMDEELDFLGFGGDQLQAVQRMDSKGWRFYIDQTNESFTVRHGRPEKWDENHVLFNGAYDDRKAQLIHDGMWPQLDYLVGK